MWIAYFDESGHTSDSKVLTVGAVIAKIEQWENFTEKWERRLRRAKVPALHMTDFERRIEPFAGWDQHKRASFITDVAAILKNNIELGVCHSVTLDDWNAVMPAIFPAEADFVRRRGPYVLLFQSCIEDIIKYVRVPAGLTIACVFDNSSFIRGAIADHYVSIRRDQQLEQVLGDLTFMDTSKTPPLQAADILAYEGYKHIVNQVIEYGTRPERKLHISLIKSKRISAGWYDRQALQSFVKRVIERHQIARPGSSSASTEI